jgi:hypothetical protein
MLENRPAANPPGKAGIQHFLVVWAKPPPGKRVIGGGASSGNRPQWG